jgi:hypothetical protein
MYFLILVQRYKIYFDIFIAVYIFFNNSTAFISICLNFDFRMILLIFMI